MFFSGRNGPGILLISVLKNSTKEWKQKVKEKKQNPPHRPKQNVRCQKNPSLCFSHEKFKPSSARLTLFSKQIWTRKAGSSVISPLENYLKAPHWTAETQAAHWASHPDVMGSCQSFPSRALSEFLQKSLHTHAQQRKEDAVNLPIPSLMLPVLTMTLNEPLQLNYIINVVSSKLKWDTRLKKSVWNNWS